MSIYKKILVTLILLTNVSVAMAQIYKCDGPEGPVYSDKECEPNAATVELSESAGLTGISDEELSELAEKKSDRQPPRTRPSHAFPAYDRSNECARGYKKPIKKKKIKKKMPVFHAPAPIGGAGW